MKNLSFFYVLLTVPALFSASIDVYNNSPYRAQVRLYVGALSESDIQHATSFSQRSIAGGGNAQVDIPTIEGTYTIHATFANGTSLHLSPIDVENDGQNVNLNTSGGCC